VLWISYVSYFFGGLFFGNAIPHFISGAMGRAFQSPFAHPPGKGLSSAFVNSVWGAFNIVVAYVLVLRVGTFDLRDTWDAVAFGAGFILMGMLAARLFGPFHGGDMKSSHRPS
jgi:hypothetical protein